MSLTTNLVSDWPMNEAAGSNLTDVVGSNTGTQHNSPGQGTALILGTHSRQFLTGSSEYFQFPSGMISSYSSWSFEIWFQPDSTDLGHNWPRIFDWGTGTSTYLMFTVRGGNFTGGVPELDLSLSGSAHNTSLPIPLVAGTTYHLVVTCTNQRVTVYLNGVTTTGLNSYNANGSNIAPTLLYLGKSQFADPYLDGKEQQARLWSRELTPQEVQALYNGGAGLANASLAGASIPLAPSPNSFGRLPYQLAFFNDGPDTLNLAESNDGVYFTQYSVTYTPNSPDVVRDPNIFYWQGTWWLVHTNTSTNGTSFTVAKASDNTLTSWSFVTRVDCSAVLGGAGNANASCWAPHAVINYDTTTYSDPSNGFPWILFAGSSSDAGGAGTNFALYAIQPTNASLTSWATGSIQTLAGTGLPANAIDPTIMSLNGSGIGTGFIMWCKNETSALMVFLSSSSLLTGWNTATTDPGSWGGAEGGSLFAIGKTLYVYPDRYGSTGIGYAYSTNGGSTWSAMAGISVGSSFIPRHGTVTHLPPAPPYLGNPTPFYPPIPNVPGSVLQGGMPVWMPPPALSFLPAWAYQCSTFQVGL